MKVRRDFLLDPNLVLYLPLWKMDGASFPSQDKHGLLCTVTGATWTPRGRDFNGTSDLISLGNPSQLIFGNGTVDNAFSIWAWAKMDDATNFAIITKGIGAAAYEYAFYTQSTDLFSVSVYSNGDGNLERGRQYSTALTSKEGQWLFFAGSYDGSGTVGGFRLYLNAIRVDDTNLTAGVYVALNDKGRNAIIGQKWETSTLNGIIGELAVYKNRVLTQIEFQNIMLATKGRYA